MTKNEEKYRNLVKFGLWATDDEVSCRKIISREDAKGNKTVWWNGLNWVSEAEPITYGKVIWKGRTYPVNMEALTEFLESKDRSRSSLRLTGAWGQLSDFIPNYPYFSEVFNGMTDGQILVSIIEIDQQIA